MAEIIFKTEVGSEIPEEIGLRFGTTRPQGGNHSHGAEAILELMIESGCH
jgi:hypothetical protein